MPLTLGREAWRPASILEMTRKHVQALSAELETKAGVREQLQ